MADFIDAFESRSGAVFAEDNTDDNAENEKGNRANS
jgi:hypothetical protein